MSAEGLLDGSSSDNSQARRACYYTFECKRDVEIDEGGEGERERRTEKEFRFRTHAPPYKGNLSLMGQLNRYYRRVHKWLFNF